MNRQTELDRALARSGWRLVRCRKHHVWQCPSACGQHRYVGAASIGKGRGIHNALATVRRLSRECPAAN